MMNTLDRILPVTTAVWLLAAGPLSAANADTLFTGRIEVALVRGGETQTLIYTAGTNCLRIERGESDHPYPRNLVDRQTGQVTLLFPHNRSFIQLPMDGAAGAPPAPTGAMSAADFQKLNGAMPGSPTPSHIGPTNLPGMSAVPAPPQMPQMPPAPPMGGGMPAMPMMAMPAEPLELAATDDTTNLLGCACRRYELKQRGEVMEIWAAITNLPFASYLQNQPPRFGPRMIEEQWAGLVASKKLFPLLAVLKFENGPERLRYEVKAVTPQKPEDQSAELFLPPADYQQLRPLPF